MHKIDLNNVEGLEADSQMKFNVAKCHFMSAAQAN